MSEVKSDREYVLGKNDSEHTRLIRQARLLEPITERCFRDAGIGLGQRVLDIGSGVGDVSLLLARIVGPTGQVVGVELDAAVLEKARARAKETRCENISFIATDVMQAKFEKPFDAIVGRLILQFLSDPVAVLCALAKFLKPGGIVAFQEPSWNSMFPQLAHLPLRSACAKLVYETFQRAQTRTDMELTLYRGIQAAGLPAPNLRIETPLGQDSETRHWLFDLMCTLRSKMDLQQAARSLIGNFDTLRERLDKELDESNSYAACIALVSAWSRKPTHPQK
jgi:ubiquinone/menaquinone biosynthesis C-methylase UbiE